LMKTFVNYELKLSKLEKELEKFNFSKTDSYGMAQVFIKNNDSYQVCNSLEDLAKSKKIKKIKLVFGTGYIEIEPKKIDICNL